jgi:hypothetical protein
MQSANDIGQGKAANGTIEIHPHLRSAIQRGWRLLPVEARGKIPLIKKWSENASSDENQIRAWMKEFRGCNWGVATGPESNLVIVDLDSDAAHERLKQWGTIPATFTVKTRRGWHLYFLYPNAAIKTVAGEVAEGIDIRGKGGQAVFPPSVHESGVVYEVINDHEPMPVPEWLLEKLPTRDSKSKQRVEAKELPTDDMQSIPQGQRNDRLFRIACSLNKQGLPAEEIEATLLGINARQCDPPLDEEEVRQIALGVTTRYEQGGKDGGSGIIVLGERPFAQVVPQAERILQEQEAERIFQTIISRRLVRVARNRGERNTDPHVKRDPEASFLAEVEAAYLQVALGRTGRVHRINSKRESLPTDAPRKLAEMMLASVRTSPEMTTWPRLKKISPTPVLLTNGDIVTEPGYHADAQIWIDPKGIDFVDLATHRPKLTATECKKLIETHVYPFICEYEFLREKMGTHWFETGAFAVALSAMMCIDDRHNLPAVPMHCISAPSQACGKTRLVQAISMLVTGTHPTIVTYDGVDEFAKHLPVLLAKGDHAVCIDNIIMPLNNAKLAALLTQEFSFSNRILGRSEDVTLENVSVLFATGVNLQLSGDMPSRYLMIRIEPDTERPEQKWFPFDQVDRAKELFPQAVMAIKAVLRAHQLNGFPGRKRLKTASRFPVWDKRIRAAIVWAGFADPIITQEAIRADDPQRTSHVRLLWILHQRFKDQPFLSSDLATRLSQELVDVVRQILGHRDGEALNENKVGKFFSHHLAGRWYDGIRLVKTGKIQGGRVEWRTESKLDDASFRVTEEPL